MDEVKDAEPENETETAEAAQDDAAEMPDAQDDVIVSGEDA